MHSEKTFFKQGWLFALGLVVLAAPPAWPEPKTPVAPPAQWELLPFAAPYQNLVEVTLQPGTLLPCLAQTPIRTDENQVGDPVEARLAQDVYVGLRKVLSRSTLLRGRVSVLEKPIAGRDAILAVTLTQVILPEAPGQRLAPLAIQSHIQTEHADHTWGGGLTEGTVPKAVMFNVWGIGSYNKEVMAGPRRVGYHYQIKPGEFWNVVLQTPLTLRVPVDPNYRP